MGLINLDIKVGKFKCKAVVVDDAGELFDMRTGRRVTASTDWSCCGYALIDALIEDGWVFSRSLFNSGVKGVRVVSDEVSSAFGRNTLNVVCKAYVLQELGEVVNVPKKVIH
mgnify:FL=1